MDSVERNERKGWGFAVSGRLTADKAQVQGGFKPRGFWRSAEVVEVLKDLTVDAIKGAEILTCMPRDVDYYRRRMGLISGKRASATLERARAEIAVLYAAATEEDAG